MVILNYKPNVTSVMFETEEAVLGKPLVVSCVSNGLPEPVYSIFHNGSLVSSGGPYKIPEVEWKHAGIYTCNARNKLGSHSGSANLTVVAKGTTTKPTNPSTTTATTATIGDNGTDPIPPTVISFTSIPKKTLLGESVVITCEALAVPLPRYTIIHNDTVVVSTHKTYIITVLKYSQAGSYKCIATNQFGNSSQAFNLSVVELPTTKIPDTKSKASAKEITAAWYIILVLLLTGFIIGCIFSFIIYHSRRKIQSRKTQSSPESPTTISRVDSTYQELDLRKMNTEENYQSLAGNAAARNKVGDECDNSTYTELNTSRDEGNNYQSLTSC
ncbi:contactin-4-like [Dendronephthya gigantea]|uniref:contactin-4-like n=1 Tax=Dendronephthya gigantea TaxID=151771 RepID=UPI001069B1A2|nr:contactin-4-like [Dendronephthya gigantea]